MSRNIPKSTVASPEEWDKHLSELEQRQEQRMSERKYPDYEALKQSFSDVPLTWLPALMIELLEAAHRRKVFRHFRQAVTRIVNSIDKDETTE